jgi:hypothetical protein
MALSRATVESGIEGFQATGQVERALRRPEDAARMVRLALQLSDAAMEARASAMKARREAEDGDVRQTWCRLKDALSR